MKTGVDNRMMNPSRSGRRRTVLVLYEGELEGNFGYWAEDEINGAEGFLDTIIRCFWIWHDHDNSWDQRTFQGRRTRKGKGKEKKEKDDKVEDSLDTLQEMRVIGPEMTGKAQRQKGGMMAIGPMKMRQRGNPKAGVWILPRKR